MEREEWSYEVNATHYDTLLEIWALEEYLRILEVGLPSLIEKEGRQLSQSVKAEDEQGLHYTEIAKYQLDEGITTRLITGSALIATWATFESAIQRAAKTLQLQQPKDGFLTTAAKFFARLGIREPNEIKDLYALRNALAHANGRVDDVGLDSTVDVRLKKRQHIERLADSLPGLKISHDGYLVVTLDFVLHAFEFIKPLLLDLASRTDLERHETGVKLQET